MANLPIIYAVSWIILLNLTLLIPKAWKWRILAYLCALVALFFVGYAIDMQSINKLHEAYARFEFYMAFALLSLAISFPSVIYLIQKKN